MRRHNREMNKLLRFNLKSFSTRTVDVSQFNRLQDNGRCDNRKINNKTQQAGRHETRARECSASFVVDAHACNQFATMAALFPVAQFMASEENWFSWEDRRGRSRDADATQFVRIESLKALEGVVESARIGKT